MANMDTLLKLFKDRCEKMVKSYEDVIIEKIAFSLFSMCHYKHILYGTNNIFELNLNLSTVEESWRLGKEKGKVANFFSLARKILELDLNKKEEENGVNKV